MDVVSLFQKYEVPADLPFYSDLNFSHFSSKFIFYVENSGINQRTAETDSGTTVCVYFQPMFSEG